MGSTLSYYLNKLDEKKRHIESLEKRVATLEAEIKKEEGYRLCGTTSCVWSLADKVQDVFVPSVEGPDVAEDAREEGYVDMKIWVCKTCARVKLEVD